MKKNKIYTKMLLNLLFIPANYQVDKFVVNLFSHMAGFLYFANF